MIIWWVHDDVGWAGLGTGGRRARQIGMKLVRIKESHSGSSSSSSTLQLLNTELHFLHIFNIHPPCTLPAVVESWRWCLATRCRPSVPGITPAHLSRPHPAPPPAPAPVSSNRKFIISGLNCPQIPTVHHHHHHQPSAAVEAATQHFPFWFEYFEWLYFVAVGCRKLKRKWWCYQSS